MVIPKTNAPLSHGSEQSDHSSVQTQCPFDSIVDKVIWLSSKEGEKITGKIIVV